MTNLDTYIFNAFEVLSTAAKATTPEDELSPEEAAEIAAENTIKAAKKRAQGEAQKGDQSRHLYLQCL